jgi:hypothetical protein
MVFDMPAEGVTFLPAEATVPIQPAPSPAGEDSGSGKQ